MVEFKKNDYKLAESHTLSQGCLSVRWQRQATEKNFNPLREIALACECGTKKLREPQRVRDYAVKY